MDKLTDFLEEVKIRLRNPLFASFILSWFIWNWKIWIGLFWLDSEALGRLNKKSYIEFVENELNIADGFFNPLISAILIILVLPLIRNLIEMYQAWALNWGERRVTEISKTGVISIEKYIEKKNQLVKQHEEFKKMAANETHLIGEVSSLEKQLEDKTYQL